MTFYWMNVDSVPINISSIAFEDSSGTSVPFTDTFNAGFPNNLNNWPFSGSPAYTRNLKNFNSRKYKNFFWARQGGPWYADTPRIFLESFNQILYPFPYQGAPAPLSNNLVQAEVSKEVHTNRINYSILSSNGLSVKRRPNTSTINDIPSPYEVSVSFNELGKSVRRLAVYPGKAGDQYEFQAGTLGYEIVTMGEPQLLAVWRHQLADILRPIHYFEADGTPFNALTSPNRDRVVMYNGNFGYTQGQNSYYFDKTIQSGGALGLGENLIFGSNLVRTFRTIRQATSYFPTTLNLNGNTTNTSSLLVDTTDSGSYIYQEWFDSTGETAPHNEQHMSYNMISTFVALTGDYMAEDELDFLTIPELLQYRPWLPATSTGSLDKNVPKYPGGGDREFGRKLLAYTTAMRVTKGDTFRKFYQLAKQLCDMVEYSFRARSNNYLNEQPPINALNYTTHGAGEGENGANDKSRIYRSGASSIPGNFRGGNEANLVLPWQRSYGIRGLDAFVKYNDDPKYRDLLLRLGRSLLLFGLYKEPEVMPAGRQGVYNNLAPSAPAMWPGMWKTIGLQRVIKVTDADSSGYYFRQLDPSCFYHAEDYMTKYWQFNSQTNQYDLRTALTSTTHPNLRPWSGGTLGGIRIPGIAQFNGNDGNYYNSSRLAATEVSCGFSAGPDGYGYIVSGLVPTGLENGLFLTEFNRQIEVQLNYFTWVFPAAQIMLKQIKDSDALRFPRILEAREKARQFIQDIFLYPQPYGEYPSNYKTLLGHGVNPNTNQPESVTSAPILPPKSLRANADILMNFAVFGPIP